MKKNKSFSPFVLYGFAWVVITVIGFFLFLHFLSSEAIPFLFLSHPAISLFFSVTFSTFFLFGLDKFQASASGLRVPENLLYLATFLGGSLGALSGMYLFRHKTRKTSFQVVIAFLLLVQLALLFFLQKNTFSF